MKAVSLNGLNDEAQYGLLLKASALNDCQEAFDEPSPFLAASAEGALPPKDPAAKDPLTVIVGGLNAFATSERPERRLEIQKVLEEGRELPLLDLGSELEELLEFLPRWAETPLECLPVYAPSLEVLPDREDVSGDVPL